MLLVVVGYTGKIVLSARVNRIPRLFQPFIAIVQVIDKDTLLLNLFTLYLPWITPTPPTNSILEYDSPPPVCSPTDTGFRSTVLVGVFRGYLAGLGASWGLDKGQDRLEFDNKDRSPRVSEGEGARVSETARA